MNHPLVLHPSHPERTKEEVCTVPPLTSIADDGSGNGDAVADDDDDGDAGTGDAAESDDTGGSVDDDVCDCVGGIFLLF